MLLFFLSELILLLFIYRSFRKRKILFRKNYLGLWLILYLVAILTSAVLGTDFAHSFWSSNDRMTGIISVIHYILLFFAVTPFLQKSDWKYVMRAVLLSGFVLAVFAFLGRDGLGLYVGSMVQGGSFLGNTTYNGMYLVLVIFLSLIGVSLENTKAWRIIYSLGILTIFLNPDLFNFNFFRGLVSLGNIWKDPLIFTGLARASSVVLWGGLIMIGLVTLMHKLRSPKLRIVGILTLIIIIFGAYAYGFASLLSSSGRVYEAYVEESGEARPIVWQIALESIKERPVFGFGSDNFNYAYQNHLDARVISLENPEWFDRAHNFVLDQLVENGILGMALVALIFVYVTYLSLRLYYKTGVLYFTFLPLILILHFLQMQTSFQTDSALFLVFIVFIFLASDSKLGELKLPQFFRKIVPVVPIVFCVSLYFFVFIPVEQNLAIPAVANAPSQQARLSAYPYLHNLKMYPPKTLQTLSGGFINETLKRHDQLKGKNLSDISKEYEIYLDLYREYLPAYAHNYRFLIDYGHLVNSSFAFGVDRLEAGEEALRNALSISEGYPHPYWLLAVNMYYQKRHEEAIEFAKRAYDLDPGIEQSKVVHDFVGRYSRFENSPAVFLHISDL
jgi:O-antigen ligase